MRQAQQHAPGYALEIYRACARVQYSNKHNNTHQSMRSKIIEHERGCTSYDGRNTHQGVDVLDAGPTRGLELVLAGDGVCEMRAGALNVGRVDAVNQARANAGGIDGAAGRGRGRRRTTSSCDGDAHARICGCGCERGGMVLTRRMLATADGNGALESKASKGSGPRSRTKACIVDKS